MSVLSWRQTANSSEFAAFTSRLFCWMVLITIVALVGCRDSKTDPSSGPQTEKPNDRQKETPGAANSNIRFTQMTKEFGIDFSYRNGGEKEQFTILESLGGGIGIIDFDADGFGDILLPGGGTFEDESVVGLPGQLYRNENGSHFKPVADFAAGGFPSPHYTHGIAVADLDADGFRDAIVTGYGGISVWKNQGDGTFLNVTEFTGIDDQSWSSSAGSGDFNGDGLIDLYLAHYVDWSFQNHPFCRGRTESERDICPPREFQPLPDSLYLANPDGTFRDASEEMGLRTDGKGLGVLIADFDRNGFVDIYVANDTTNNFLYLNDGVAPLREVAMLAGVAADKIGIPNGSMGVDSIDFDGSARPDIWVTNYEREDFAIYRNEGNNAFLHVSDIYGLNLLGGLFVGFGTVCSDLDLDGDEDIMINNGHVILFPTASPRAQTPLVLENRARRFQKKTFEKDDYLMQPHEGRGLALCDYDQDGDPDALFSNLNASAVALRNDSSVKNGWVRVQLIGRGSNRDAVGATASLMVEGKPMIRQCKGASSYLSSSEKYLTWGLGEMDSTSTANCGPLTITWPGGGETVIEEIRINELTRIVEPGGPSSIAPPSASTK